MPLALRNLGYEESAIADIIAYAVGHGTLRDAPGINHARLTEKGFTAAQFSALQDSLANAFDISFAFNKWTLGEEFCRDILGFTTNSWTIRFQYADRAGLHQGRNRRGEQLLLRRHDPGRARHI